MNDYGRAKVYREALGKIRNEWVNLLKIHGPGLRGQAEAGKRMAHFALTALNVDTTEREPDPLKFVTCPKCEGKPVYDGFGDLATCGGVCRGLGTIPRWEPGIVSGTHVALLWWGEGQMPPAGIRFTRFKSCRFKGGHYTGEGATRFTVVGEADKYLIVRVDP